MFLLMDSRTLTSVGFVYFGPRMNVDVFSFSLLFSFTITHQSFQMFWYKYGRNVTSGLAAPLCCPLFFSTFAGFTCRNRISRFASVCCIKPDDVVMFFCHRCAVCLFVCTLVAPSEVDKNLSHSSSVKPD